MKKNKYLTATFILLLNACGGSSSGNQKGVANLNTAYRPEMCEAGDSRPLAIVNTQWSLVDPNTNTVNNSYQLAISESNLTVYTRCEDNGVEVEVTVPYEINGKNFVVLASDSRIARNSEGEACEISVSQSTMQFGRSGNTLYFCDKDNGNLTYQLN